MASVATSASEGQENKCPLDREVVGVAFYRLCGIVGAVVSQGWRQSPGRGCKDVR